MFAVLTVIFIAVVALWLYALTRRHRSYSGAQTRQTAKRWIVGGGILLPLITVLFFLAVGLPAGYRMLPVPVGDTLTVQVVGHQWWWEVHYPEAGVTTANELKLPVDRPVDFYLTSSDVIHSFWIPRLGGKLDVLPGRTNVLRLEASEAGFFRAQCAEFCGWGHAHMVLPVEAVAQADFDEWLNGFRQPINVDEEHQRGAKLFVEHCGSCHAVNGIADGRDGPDLTSIGQRPLIGGVPVREIEGITYWLSNHAVPSQRTNKEDIPVPNHRLIAPEHHREIAAWLETLGNE